MSQNSQPQSVTHHSHQAPPVPKQTVNVKELLNEFGQRFQEKVNAHISELIASLHLRLDGANTETADQFGAMNTTLDGLTAKIGVFLQRVTSQDISAFLVPGALKARYYNEHAEEKKALARYLAHNPVFFPRDKQVFAFVQASVTAIHLARELAEKGLRPGCLFGTNSVVLPMILLQDNCQVSVYTLCGLEYDNLCGGWLPRHDDDEAKRYLYSLFAREKDPLQDAYITPMAVMGEHATLCFTRNELLSVINILLERAKRLVIMTVSSRVFPTRADAEAHPALMYTQLHGLSLENRLSPGGERPQLVISRDHSDQRSDDDLRRLIGQLATGMDIHWQDLKGDWRVVEGAT